MMAREHRGYADRSIKEDRMGHIKLFYVRILKLAYFPS